MACSIREHMNQILHFDWLTEQAKWCYLASCILQENGVLYSSTGLAKISGYFCGLVNEP